MRKYLLLSWFYKGEFINSLFFNLIKTLKPCQSLKLLYLKHQKEIEHYIEELKLKEVKILTLVDENYPSYLKKLDIPVWVICAFGDLKLLEARNRVGLVGSREPDVESKRWIFESMKKVDKSVVIISGGAIGIDQHVHVRAHQNGLKGVCVLPVGILEMYPKRLKGLVKVFLKTHDFLLISQFHPRQRVCRSFFHPRNYLIAALSKKIVVVQAQKKSGTMVTAKFARDFGKDVYVVPSPPWSRRFSGNVSLLEEGAYQIIDLDFIHL